MNNPKALQTFLDLEIARCNERWTDIPELARRYKKYHPYESVLEFTARMEAEFILLLRQVRQEKSKSIIPIVSTTTTSQLDLQTSTSNSRKWGTRQIATISSTNLNTPPAVVAAAAAKKNYTEESDFIHQLDDPNNVAMSLPLESSQAQLILVRLLDVIQRQIKSGQLETIDDWQAQFSKIILARIYFETERYDKTLEWLQQLALKLEDVESGYSMVLLVQARVMKGVCYEAQENHIDALDCYLSALKVVEDHPDEENKSLSYWVENCLYRAILLQLRKKGPVKQTLKLMRAYLNYCCTQWPLDWRIHKRWVIFRHYIRYLTRAYQKGVYVPATAQDEYISSPVLSPTKSVFSDAGETTLFERSSAALEETILLTTQFRQLLATFAPLLNQSNPADLHHRTLELSHLLVSAHETVGWGPDSYVQRTLKYFVRTRKFTFNSLCTTRHIFYTLVRVGETKQAKLALTCYLELLGVPDFIECYQNMDLVGLVDAVKAKLQSITQSSSESGSNNLYQIETKLNGLLTDELSSEDDEVNGALPKKKSATGSCESDTEFDVVRMLLWATQYLYPNSGLQATVLTDIAVALLEESDFLKKKKASQWRALMVQAKRLCGTSYALYASQCHDEEKRSEYLTESLLSLKRATELDPRSWQAFYQLGIQQALTGDMPAASNSVKRSIKLRGDFIPSWHLLSLIQSSRQFHALPKSLQVIQAGLVYHLNLVENEDNEDITQDLRLDTEEGQEFFDRAEAFLKMRLSQAAILENLEGAESTIKVYPDLFDMYSKLSKKMNIALVEKANTTAARKSSLHESSIRSRSRSRANSSVHSIDEKSSESLDSGFALPLPADDFKIVEESQSLTLNKTESRSSHRLESRSLNKVTEDEEDNDEEDYVPEKVTKTKKKKRGSINLSQLMDDPLISLPSKTSKEKKEKKEKPLKRSTTFLSLKRSDSSRKDLEQEVPSSSSLKEISRNNSSSNNTVKSNTLLGPHQNSNYSSLLDKVDESTISLVSATTTTTTTTPTTTIEKNDYFKERQIRWHNILVDIWIMTSATYARALLFEEAHKAIMEADELTFGANADVWHQVGKNCLLEGLSDRAVDAYKRALSIDPDHISTHISLSSVYLSMGHVELAEQLLQKSTRGLGWNQTEAWFLLSKVYQDQENLLDAKKCLLFALKLSDMSPIVSVSSLPRFV